MKPLDAFIVGSLPKPFWLAEPGQLRAPWKLRAEDLAAGQRDATVLAVHHQERSGLDLITDGEQSRRHYISHFAEKLHGFDYGRLVEKKTRGGKYSAMVPAISERVAWTGPVLREDLTLLLASTDRPVKITVPGPLTIADTAVSEAYADPDDLIMDLAAAVNAEAKSLAELGPAMIQIDEPAFNAEPETARRIGIAALDRCLEGVECATAVHICYGYGTESVLRWKNANTSWGQYEQLLPLLAGSRVDVLSLEFAAPKLSPDVLELAGDKCVAFGCIDVSPAPEERPEGIARKLEGALRVITEDRLYPSTDCGMAPLNYELAVRKMHSLGEAVALLRGARDRP